MGLSSGSREGEPVGRAVKALNAHCSGHSLFGSTTNIAKQIQKSTWGSDSRFTCLQSFVQSSDDEIKALLMEKEIILCTATSLPICYCWHHYNSNLMLEIEIEIMSSDTHSILALITELNTKYHIFWNIVTDADALRTAKVQMIT